MADSKCAKFGARIRYSEDLFNFSGILASVPFILGKCIKHLIYCFCANEAVPYAAMSSAPETNDLIQNISDVKAIPILWFAATLVDEVNKTDSNSVKQLSKWSEILELHH